MMTLAVPDVLYVWPLALVSCVSELMPSHLYPLVFPRQLPAEGAGRLPHEALAAATLAVVSAQFHQKE